MWAPIAMGALGAYRGIKNEKRMKDNDKFRKAAIQYSPWTGMGDPGSQQLPGMLESGLQGAATGAMLGSSLGSLGGATAPATNAAVGQQASAGALGSKAMTQELGQMGNFAAPQAQPFSVAGVDGMSAPGMGSQFAQNGQWGLMRKNLGSL